MPEIRARLQGVADQMLNTMHAAPQVIKDHLTQVVDGRDSTHYGPLTTDPLVSAMSWISPVGDLSAVRASDLQAPQELQKAWSWLATADPYTALVYLGTGRTVTSGWSGNYDNAADSEAADDFRVEYLLVGGESVEYLAAGVSLAFLVATGKVTELSVTADPFGNDENEYNERVTRAKAFQEWRDSARNTLVAEAGHLMPKYQLRELQARVKMPALEQVAAFRAEMVEK